MAVRIQSVMPSRATRKINFRSRVSGRASLVRLRRYDGQLVNLVAESVAEVRCVNLIMARTDIVDVWDQPPPVLFTKTNGKAGTHTFDYLVEFVSGRRVAIAVKPSERAFRINFSHELSRIADAMPTTFAHAVCLHTERSATAFQMTNAATMCEFVKQPDMEADRAVMLAAHRINGRIRLDDLVKLTGLGGRAYRAAHRAIYDGKLVACKPGLITPAIIIQAHVKSDSKNGAVKVILGDGQKL